VQGCLVDSNVWVALTFPAHSRHRTVRDWVAAATSESPLLWCRETQMSYLRLVSMPAIHRGYQVPRVTNADAFALLDELISMPNVLVVSAEPPEVWTLFRALALSVRTAPRVYMDAYLAAWAIAADVPLATLDADFEAFRAHGLKLQLLV
jgi:toxin-antitoxin system PIN domain toxin